MISFKWAPNINDKSTRVLHLLKENPIVVILLITQTVTNISKPVSFIEEGNVNTAGAIYSGHCTEDKKMDIG